MRGVDGRVAIITGAGGGVGRQHALLLAARGAKVVVNDMGSARDGTGQSTQMADAVVDEITAAGGQAVASYDSVAELDSGKRIVDVALSAFGRVDVVVNNAGILRDRTFHKMSEEEWEAVLAVHLYGAYYVTRAAWPHLREQGHGRVIVTSSTSGLYGNFGQSNYAAAKLGVVGLIKTLALEGEQRGVTANVVVPMAATRMTADVMPAEELADLDPSYVAPLVAHLASDECTETGTITLAGGGRYARIEVFEAPGAHFDHVPSVEELAAAWPQVTDLTDAAQGYNPL